MQYTRDYFQDEVREGFYIPAMTKCSWAAQMDILERVALVCEKYDIKWFADCGTLLGTVRHQGFIPWDDDLDICMLRDDYIRFNEVILKELPKGYWVLNLKNEDKYENFITRITNGNEINTSDEYLNEHCGFPYVAGIDIYPLDFLSPDEKSEEIRKNKARRLWDIARIIQEDSLDQKETEAVVMEIEELCQVSIDRKKPLKKALLLLIEEVFSEYSREGASHVALMPFWTLYGSHKYPISYFEEEVKLPFENMLINVPSVYEEVLKIEYGNWTKINRKGSLHDYPFYKEQEQMLTNAAGGKLAYKYYFSMDDLHNKDRKNGSPEPDIYAKSLQVIVKAHEMINMFIKKKDSAGTLELLEKCQMLAIQVGNEVEKTQGEGFITVKMLEDYCELVYQLYEKIAAGQFANTRRERDMLSKSIQMIQNSYTNDIKRRKEAVFFPYKASLWKYMEEAWREACEDPDYDVYVVPIPYYDKKPNGTLLDEHYDLEDYPDYIRAISYLSFDYKQKHPDKMFIQSPYDEANYTTSVHPFFYAKNLKSYTDQLIYIPYFLVDEIDFEDEKSIINTRSYVTSPGVVHADKVIVQSEQMRKAYVEILTEFAGKGTKRIWEKKIVASKSPIYDYMRDNTHNDCRCPDCWRSIIVRSDGSRKKIILYYTGVSSLLQYEGKMIGKLKATLEIFKRAKDDVALIWKPNPMIKENMVRLRPQLWKEYEELVGAFKEDGWGIYDESEDVEMVVSMGDGYYGDPGYLMNLCQKKGMPVMLQRVY